MTRQAARRLLVPVGIASRTVDRVRRTAWRRRHPVTHPDTRLGGAPEAVFAVVAHWRPEAADAAGERGALLARVVETTLRLQVDCVVVAVLTNQPESVARDLATHLRGVGATTPVRVEQGPRQLRVDGASGLSEALVVRWRPGLIRRHGFYLTWGHVGLLRHAWRSGAFSHLVYLEDDMVFTDELLRYWCRHRLTLAELGLLPGFVRFEEHDGDRYIVDQRRPVDPDQRRVTVTTGQFVNLKNPYQGMYVLDRAMADEHFRFSVARSPLRSRVRRWGIRERASMGPIFDDVPKGFVSRNVVPAYVRGGRLCLDRSCLIEHAAGTYARDPRTSFGTVKVDDLFAND